MIWETCLLAELLRAIECLVEGHKPESSTAVQFSPPGRFHTQVLMVNHAHL